MAERDHRNGCDCQNHNQQASGTAVPAIGTTTLAADNAGAMQSRDDGWAGAVMLRAVIR